LIRRQRALLTLAAVCACILCSCERTAAVVVASKNFTEQIILGEIAAQQIERKLHVTVERRLDLGGTLLAHLALVKGEIDLYPEYTGTALTSVLKHRLASDPGQVFKTVATEYERQFHLTWLPPLGFNDSFAMVVREEDAQPLSRPALSAAESRSWRLGVGYEFLTRPDGLRRLNALYRIRWQGVARTMDLGLLYRALDQRQIDIAAANSTDGLLTSGRYAILADDRHAFPPYQACFIVRDAKLNGQPGLREAMTELAGSIDDKRMRELNRRVDIGHERVVRVAASFLQELDQKKR
jgi:glycine betaine/choline ABC-type transport system substrate-binding protein